MYLFVELHFFFFHSYCTLCLNYHRVLVNATKLMKSIKEICFVLFFLVYFRKTFGFFFFLYILFFS